MSNTTACPDCRQPLDGSPACPHCQLPLTGPSAARLWAVDQRLAALDGEQHALRTERIDLLTALRTGVSPASRAALAATVLPSTAAPETVRPETSAAGVQNTLLTLGALLLAVAALVFGAVTYQHLGATGRALVLLALTSAAAAAPVVFARRGLTATAEALTGVALVLALLDVWAFRRAGLGAAGEPTTYTACALVLLAVLTALYATRVPVRTARIAAVLLAQPAVPLLLLRFHAGAVVASLALASLAAANVLLRLSPRLPADSRATATAVAVVAQVGALEAVGAAVANDRPTAAFALLAVAAVAVLATRGTSALVRGLLAGLTVVLLSGAALAAVAPTFPEMNQPLVLAAAALLLALATNLLPVADRTGALAGAVLVSAGAVAAHGEQLLLALAGPLTWLAHPWTLTGPAAAVDTSARAAVSTELVSRATPALLLVLVASTGTVLVAGLLLDRLRDAALPAVALGLLALVVLPVAVGATYPVALAVLVVVTALLVAAALLVSQRADGAAGAALALALVPGLIAGAWAVADRDATLAVLPCLTALAAVAATGSSLARRTGAATALALVVTGAELAAVGFAADLLRHQVGSLLIAAPALAVGMSLLLRGTRRHGAETAAVLLAVVAVVLAHDDVDALSWTLAASGLLALVVAVRPDRRLVGIAGGLLLSASSWVRLADAGVHAPEPYVLPLALAALVAGHLRRRTHGVGSLEAYGSGLTLALVPVLLRSVADDDPTRGLLLLLASGVVVLLGAHHRLRAPLLIGGGVLAADALVLLAPYASALPRWSVIATTGAALLTVGATYEQRRRDVARLRGELATWS